MPATPNPLNTFIGAGIVKWKGPGDLTYRDVGETDAFTISPSVDQKNYRSKRTTARRIARSMTNNESVEIGVTLKELEAYNLALFVLGSVEEPSGGDTWYTVRMMATPDMTGFIRFVGTTSVGEPAQVDAKVNLAPNGDLDLLTDDFGGFQITAQVVQDDEAHYDFGIIRIPITEEIDD